VVTGTVLRTRGRSRVRRAVAAIGTLVAAALAAFVVGPAVAATNVPRPEIGATPASVGLAYEDVTLTTADGVRLAGWYVPSSNGAAVVLRHGAGSTRSNVLPEAEVLARHGFGVLAVDARGHGQSEGRAMDFGWHGDADIAAATAFLTERDDVDGDRIAVAGSSMGGEEAIGASASDVLIRAVVAEGATARTAADKGWLSDEYGLRGLLQEQVERVQYWLTDILTSAGSPRVLRSAVAESGTTRYLLITAGDAPDEAQAAAYIASAAPDRVRTWNVSGAAHTDGLAVAPEEWETRVVTFLADALDVRAASKLTS
jgi:pimeloyl-ACP methyl ester carboxylesterase